MRDLLQPTTDAGNLAQLLLVIVLWVAGFTWTWRRAPWARPLVGGLGMMALGLLALRAAH